MGDRPNRTDRFTVYVKRNKQSLLRERRRHLQIRVTPFPRIGKSPIESKLETSIADGAASLESILCMEELLNRPWRPPDYEKENSALVALVSAQRIPRRPFCKRWLIKPLRPYTPIQLA